MCGLLSTLPNANTTPFGILIVVTGRKEFQSLGFSVLLFPSPEGSLGFPIAALVRMSPRSILKPKCKCVRQGIEGFEFGIQKRCLSSRFSEKLSFRFDQSLIFPFENKSQVHWSNNCERLIVRRCVTRGVHNKPVEKFSPRRRFNGADYFDRVFEYMTTFRTGIVGWASIPIRNPIPPAKLTAAA